MARGNRTLTRPPLRTMRTPLGRWAQGLPPGATPRYRDADGAPERGFVGADARLLIGPRLAVEWRPSAPSAYALDIECPPALTPDAVLEVRMDMGAPTRATLIEASGLRSEVPLDQIPDLIDRARQDAGADGIALLPVYSRRAIRGALRRWLAGLRVHTLG